VTERELVKCGCGLVRNDEDAISVGMAVAARATSTGYNFESPRICRGCGCVYMLPKPSAPKGKDDAK
jgi:hypothetical protein